MRFSTLLLLLAFACISATATVADSITGIAGYRERIAVPDNATFEARLEDISLADAPAVLIGQAIIEDAGNPPYRFEIAYDAAEIVAGHSYAVRATLRLDDRLLFTSDTVTPVITRGAGTEVEITMVSATASHTPSNRMIGEFIYFADAAVFTDCVSGESYPVAQEGDYIALERSYIETRPEPMAPLVVVVVAEIADREGMEGGTRPMVVVDRTVGLVPGLTCDRAKADADIENTYWRMLTLDGRAVETPDGGREPNIRFLPADGGFSSTVGCNLINGGYTLDGTSLTLSPGPMTMMACPPPLDSLEFSFVDLLGTVAEVNVIGPTMELLDANGQSVAFLEAVALP